MLDKENIEEFLKAYLKSFERESSGSSGHLSNTSCMLGEYNFSYKGGLYEIVFSYTEIIETEFTYYPDNPPYEYKYSKKIVLNSNKEIVEETDLPLAENSEVNWLGFDEKIRTFLKKVLLKIEWQYGDNRAPFRYPPTLKYACFPFSKEYQCILEDYGEHEEDDYTISGTTPEELFTNVKAELPKYISLDIWESFE